jgi:hypothetical protein
MMEEFTISLHVSSERDYTPEEWGEIITKAERILALAGVYGPVRTEDERDGTEDTHLPRA